MAKKVANKKAPITPKELGMMFYKEFDRDDWGDVDTYEFKHLPKSTADRDVYPMAGLYEVVERVAKKINERFGV